MILNGTLFLLEIGNDSAHVLGANIIVSKEGNGDFLNIQDALDNAKSGDTIYIWSGTYYENLVIDKSLSIIGNGTENTSIIGNGIDYVVKLISSWVNVTSLTITGSGTDELDANLKLININNCKISDVNCSSGRAGILLESSNFNMIEKSVINSTTFSGISLYASNDNIIQSNTCSGNNKYGIYLQNSDNVEILNNQFNYNFQYGLYFQRSKNIVMKNNKFENSGVVIKGELVSHWVGHNIEVTNTVNLKPIYYYSGKNSVTVPANAGQIIVAQSTNMKIENQNFDKTSIGIQMAFSNGNSITNNICNNNIYGIFSYFSDNNLIEDNICNNNLFNGIELINSHFIKLYNNFASNKMFGINCFQCNDLDIKTNTCTFNGRDGIKTIFCMNTSIENNFFNLNRGNGISIEGSESITLIENNCNSNSFDGINIINTTKNNIVLNNTCSFNHGKGLYLDKSEDHFINNNILSLNARDGLFLKYSNDNNLSGNEINSNSNGIYLYSSDENVILNNEVNSNNHQGLYVIFSFNNLIIENEGSENCNGIYLESSSINIISNNSFSANDNDGIILETSPENEISYNIVSLNKGNGISLIPATDEQSIRDPDMGLGSGNIYYLSTSGSDSNNGTTEQLAWRTMNFASSQVSAGDTVYVKKGNYGFDRSSWPDGVAGSPIRIIGYSNTPGDIVSDGYPTWKDTFEMPTIGTGNGYALIRLGSYCEIYNFYLHNNTYGITLNRCNNGKIFNCYVNALVYGIVLNDEDTRTLTSNHWVENCSVINASARGFSVAHCNNSRIRGCYLESHYRTDYPIQVVKSSYNIIENCVIQHKKNSMYGKPGWSHHGHGLVHLRDSTINRPSPDCGQWNIVRNCTRIGKEFELGIEISGRTSNHTIENCSNLSIVIRNGAHHNTIKDMEMNYKGGISLSRIGETPIIGTHNNTFIRIKMRNIPKPYSSSSAINLQATENLVFKNSIFYNVTGHLFNLRWDYPMEITMENCIFEKIADFEYRSIDPGPTSPHCDYDFSYSCFYNNGFSMPIGTGNIETDPLFADPIIGDFHLESEYGRWDGTKWIFDEVTSPCIDSGNPKDYYRHEPQPNGGRINMGVYGNTIYTSKSSIDGEFGYYPDSFDNSIIGNDILVNSKIGLLLNKASTNNIEENDFDNNTDGILLKGSFDNYFAFNYIKSSIVNSAGLSLKDSNNNLVVSTIIENTGKDSIGMILNGYSSTIINSSISNLGINNANNGLDLICTNNGTLIAINCTYETIEVTQDWGGTLKNLNYLNVQVFNHDEITPRNDVDILVINDDETIYKTPGYNGINPTTDSNGQIKNILLMDRWYVHSNNATENSTSIRVKEVIKDELWEELRTNISMQNSHSELFYVPDILPPEIPVGLKIKRFGYSNTLNISWDQNKNTRNYTIYKLVTNKWQILENITHPNNWTYDKDQDDENYYYYRIQAWSGLNLPSKLSESVSFYLKDITPPPTPTGLMVETIPKDDSINLSWNLNRNDTIYYDIWYSITNNNDWIHVGNTTHPNNYFLWSNRTLENNNKYYFKIRAIDKVFLSSPFTESVNVTHKDEKAPNAPILFARTLINKQIELNWIFTQDEDIIGYKIFMNLSGYGTGGPYKLIDTTQLTKYLLTNLMENTTYYFVISAFDEVNNTSPFSNEARNTTFPHEEPPKIIATIPIKYSDDIPINTTIKIIFNMPVNTSTTKNAITINPEEDYHLNWFENNKIMEIVFERNLSYNTRYQVHIDQIKDIIGRDYYNIPFLLVFRTARKDGLGVVQNLTIVEPVDGKDIKKNVMFTIFGTSAGFQQGTNVSITLLNITKTVQIDENGYWLVSFEAPSTVGKYQIKVSIGELTRTVNITVIKNTETSGIFSNIMVYFLIFIIILVIVTLFLVYYKKDNDNSDNKIDLTKDAEQNIELLAEPELATKIEKILEELPEQPQNAGGVGQYGEEYYEPTDATDRVHYEVAEVIQPAPVEVEIVTDELSEELQVEAPMAAPVMHTVPIGTPVQSDLPEMQLQSEVEYGMSPEGDIEPDFEESSSLSEIEPDQMENELLYEPEINSYDEFNEESENDLIEE